MKILNNDHTLIHSAKVVLFIAILCKKLNINQSETIKLMIAGVLHDIGRVNNCNDKNHGSNSVKIAIENKFIFDESIISEIIKNHCIVDSKINVNEEIKKLILLFKDADALDRIRTNDLDTKYLRNENSKLLINFSKQLNEIVELCLNN